jgi:hypothetical protein
MKKHIDRICRNCKLFDPKRLECSVVILHEGQRLRLPVDATDVCFFEQEYFDPTTEAMENFNEIQEVKFWVEDEKGEKTDGNGVVKMEFPTNFFGNLEEED